MDDAWCEAIADLLARSHLLRTDLVADRVDAVLRRLSLSADLYLADPEQRALHWLPRPGAAGSPSPLEIDGSLAGRAFATVRPLSHAPRGLWVPVVDGTERLGVLDLAMPDTMSPDDPDVRSMCVLFAGLVGHLITSKNVYGDALLRSRRTAPMSAAAELLWQLLPPLTYSTDTLTVSAIMEPCYEVGGDGFDYAVDGATAHVSILDAAGRGLPAGLACGVALSAIRASRRAGEGLYGQARAADAALGEQFDDLRFVTAVLTELDLNTGRLRYVNAGHPRPLHLRAGRLIGELAGGRRMPLGLDDAAVVLGETFLQRNDRLLLHTDGITEARSADDTLFGTARLVELIEHFAQADLPTPETLRRLSHAVTDRQGGLPADDATLLLLDWSSAAAQRNVP